MKNETSLKSPMIRLISGAARFAMGHSVPTNKRQVTRWGTGTVTALPARSVARTTGAEKDDARARASSGLIALVVVGRASKTARPCRSARNERADSWVGASLGRW